MRKVYVGMDLGCKTCAAAVGNARGKLIEQVEFRTSEKNLIDFVEGLKAEVRILFEEGELAGWVYRTLLPHAKSVEACDPKRNAWVFKSGKKGDPIDARKLSEILFLGSYSPVYHPAEERMAVFKIAVQHYDQLVRSSTRTKNQIKARFRQQGIMIDDKRVYGLGRIKEIERVGNPTIRTLLEQDFRLLDTVERQRMEAYALIRKLSRDFPVIERLKRIPGIGPLCAARFVAYVGNPHRFNNRSLWQFSRLGITNRESGGSPLGRQHLDKSGNGPMKALSRTAFNGAMSTRCDNGLKRCYRRSLSRTGNSTHARLNTQRKILAIMLSMWKNGTEYSDELVTERA